ncbi:2-octaprenylphenol hydroxylase [invertebrate metagenome]|uniref:2-octaprenylphenol hydroxylase n=1 Tax=invertebrate metagenome TaxID=1711999 RepID=A0A2H9T7B0_9ZZZZ
MRSRPSESTFDIIIVGGGVVGASLALALSQTFTETENSFNKTGHPDKNNRSQKPLSIALLDCQSLHATNASEDNDSSSSEYEPNLFPYSPRVSALNHATIRFFQTLGIWNSIQETRSCPYHHMTVWENPGTGHIDFDASAINCNDIGHIVENQVIRQALLNAIAQRSVTCFDHQSSLTFNLDTKPSQIILNDGSAIYGSLLIAADGAQSVLRSVAGIPVKRQDYRHHAIVTTVETEHYHQDTAWQVFLETGPLAFLPMPDHKGKHYCSIVWSLVPDVADTIESSSDQDFCENLSLAFEQTLGRVIRADHRLRFPLSQSHASSYYHQNVVLTGDAAHTIHPLAGQGVNLGIQDAVVLAAEIRRAYQRQDNIAGQHILSRYQRCRKTSVLSMIHTMKGFHDLFSSNHLTLRWLRNTGLRITDRQALLKQFLLKQALGSSEASFFTK